MFEPIGGSAHEYAGSGQIHPLAAICSVQMLLEYLGERETTEKVLGAVKYVLKEKLTSLGAGKIGYSSKEVGDLVVGCLV